MIIIIILNINDFWGVWGVLGIASGNEARNKSMICVGRSSVEVISELPQEDEDAAEVEEAEEVLHLHLVAGDETTEVLKPGEKPLYLPAAPVSTQLTFILSLRLAPSTVRGNQLHSRWRHSRSSSLSAS